MASSTGIAWGTTASGTGAEGAPPRSAWARWEADGRVPASNEGNGFGVDFARDWSMLAEHGLTTHRMAIEWARIEPAPGQVDGDAVEHARAVLRSARDAGIDVWVTLHHEVLPGWFAEDEGGFADERGRTYFWPRHVDRIGELFGDLVAGWVPIEDPVGFAVRGWSTGVHPPGRQDPEAFSDVLRAVHLAGLGAWDLLRSGGRPVATSYALTPVEPGVRSRHPDERTEAARRADRLDHLLTRSWLDALVDGKLALPGRAVEEIPRFAGAYDIVGFTYDGARSVYADGTTGPYPTDAREGPTGTAPWPEGLGHVLRRLHDAGLRRPFMVTGTGVATPATDQLQDEWRCEILRGLGVESERALADGIDLRAVLLDTAVDGYEWEHGFTVQRGLFDRLRNPKPSAAVAAELAGVTPPH